MSKYPPIPLDVNRTPMQTYPPAVSVVAIYASENGTASSVINLTHDTTAVEIAAVNAPAFMRWVRTADTQGSVVNAVSGANFQHVVSNNTLRQFVVPIEQGNAGGYSSAQGVNRAEGLYRRLAYKTQGNASVLVTEYTIAPN